MKKYLHHLILHKIILSDISYVHIISNWKNYLMYENSSKMHIALLIKIS